MCTEHEHKQSNETTQDDPELTEAQVVIAVARVCYEANRSLEIALGRDPGQPWETAPEYQRSSCIAGAKILLSEELRASDLHERWVAYKTSDGWKHGPVKDPEKKEHPSMTDFESLPLTEKLKNALFLSVGTAVAQGLFHIAEVTYQRSMARRTLSKLGIAIPNELQFEPTAG